MKHITILILIAATFCFASCNNSDSSDATTIQDSVPVNSASGTGSAVTGTGSARDTGRTSSSEKNSSGSTMSDSSNVSNGSAVTGTGSSRDSGQGSFR